MTKTIKPFLGENFLLENDIAADLYHNYAKDLPIIDYHCHLPPAEIADDKNFENLTQIWLAGDHYKWRAMRANGISEKYITGDASDWEKFEKWAETVPFTMRNPLYHWTHLELQRYFEIDNLLKPQTATEIFEECNAQLTSPNFSTRNLLQKRKVEVVCTTDDPIDSLEYHRQIQADEFDIKILPTFRPDRAILIENQGFTDYIRRLAQIANIEIANLFDLLSALQKRLDLFHELGGRLADHGLEQMYAADFTDREVERIFRRRMDGHDIFPGEALLYQSALLYYLAEMYHEKGWTQQFHLGALRNNNDRMVASIGADVGCDSIGDFQQAAPLSRFLNRLDSENKLTKTILYNLNPRDNEVFATMVGNFNDGSLPGKMQFGSAWWFLDQKDGIEKQLNALSNMGLLSRFVGMLTDSRSFMSYPRHEYFRRILCNLLGEDVERGALPNEVAWLGKMVQNICYRNAKNYFNF